MKNYINNLASKARKGDKEATIFICNYFQKYYFKKIPLLRTKLYTSEDILADINYITAAIINLCNKKTINDFYYYNLTSINNLLNDKSKKYSSYEYIINSNFSFSNCNDEDMIAYKSKCKKIYGSFEEELCTRMDLEKIQLIIEMLKPEDREILTFIGLENHSYKEYIDKKNISPNAAYKRFKRASLRLKRLCKDYYIVNS